MDIENFLKTRAIVFEKLGKSRTFIVYDEDAEEFTILGYFSLALQVLKIPEEFSNRQIKRLDGFGAKIHGSVITEIPTILIGQLGKNDLYPQSISGDELMTHCLTRLFKGQENIGGRVIMLECKNVEYLLDFYGKYGFKLIEKEYEADEYLQLIKVLTDEEIVEFDN